MHKLFTTLNLRLFDGEGAPGAEGGEAATADKVSLADVKYGKQEAARETDVTSDTEEARKADFEKLIKGDYKDLYDARVKQHLDARFKETEGLRAKAAQADALSPVLEMLASKYGVDGKDAQALAKAIQEDDSYYEDEALQKGLSVEQLKQMKRMERENAEFKRAIEEQQRQKNADRVFAQWTQQSEELRRVYPSFDLQAECSNAETGDRFLSLLKSGVDVKTSYEVIHHDEILGGAMQYTAQKVQQKTVNDIRTRGLRPQENGAGASAAAIVKTDPSKFTKADRDEIARRTMRGEGVVL